jgi:hypothetical protein
MEEEMKILYLGICESGHLDVMKSTSSLEMVTCIASECFKNRDVEFEFIDCRKIDSLPKADLVVFTGFNENLKSININSVKQGTGCNRFVTLLEIPFLGVDHSYCFLRASLQNSTLFGCPVHSKLYENKKKVKGSILLDHIWAPYVGTNNEHTPTIQKWLKEDKYSKDVYHLVGYKPTPDTTLHNSKPSFNTTLMDFEKPIIMGGFDNYIKETNKIETFVITHLESYCYSITDMIVRGTRVIAPVGTIDGNEQKDVYGIKTFGTKEEFLFLIYEPVDKKHLSSLKEYMTEYQEIIDCIIDDSRR